MTKQFFKINKNKYKFEYFELNINNIKALINFKV